MLMSGQVVVSCGCTLIEEKTLVSPVPTPTQSAPPLISASADRSEISQTNDAPQVAQSLAVESATLVAPAQGLPKSKSSHSINEESGSTESLTIPASPKPEKRNLPPVPEKKPEAKSEPPKPEAKP